MSAMTTRVLLRFIQACASRLWSPARHLLSAFCM